MLMLGDQKVRPLYMSLSPWEDWALYFALPSVEMMSAISSIISSSNMAARPMAWGNTVAVPALATPWSASFHQL